MGLESWEVLAPFVMLGLLGAGHCAGMCGGFAIALAARSGKARLRALQAQLAYTIGKALTYASLGLLVAQVGGRLVGAPAELSLGDSSVTVSLWQTRMAWLAGGLMILLGVLAIRGRAPAPPPGLRARLEPWMNRMRRLFQGATELPGMTGALATGLITGALPCGWSWGALALCLTLSPLAAMSGMFVFGIGTAPILIILGMGWQGFSNRFGGVAAKAAGPLMIIFGLLTLLRASPRVLGPVAQKVLPECCAEQGRTVAESGHSHP